MIPNLFILSNVGEVLIEKHWGTKVKRTLCELFMEQVSNAPAHNDVLPVIATPKYYLIHIYRCDLFFLTVVSREVPPLLVVELQQRVVETLIDYLKLVNETSIRENFSLIYQLLDEMIDGGFPCTTEDNQLKDMILLPSLARRMFTGEAAVTDELAGAVVSKIPWRRSNCKYSSNEIYFDILENLDVSMTANGVLQACSIFGEIRCKCSLSGMPDLTLSFTKPQLLEDCSLHRCVRIQVFMNKKVLSFVPPDGDFTLLKYKLPGNCQIPIVITPKFSWQPGVGRVNITVGTSGLGPSSVMQDVRLYIPFPSAVTTFSLTTNVGEVRIDELTKTVRWEIGVIAKDVTPRLEGSVSLPPDFALDERPTIRVHFQVKKHCSSGLKVDSLQVKNVSYKPFKGVRVFTQAGKFYIRTG